MEDHHDQNAMVSQASLLPSWNGEDEAMPLASFCVIFCLLDGMRLLKEHVMVEAAATVVEVPLLEVEKNFVCYNTIQHHNT